MIASPQIINPSSDKIMTEAEEGGPSAAAATMVRRRQKGHVFARPYIMDRQVMYN